MEANGLLLNFRSGNKGFIFLLDSMIALFITTLILVTAVFFLSRSEESPIEDMQASRFANDIFAVLDYRGILRKFDINDIRNELNNLVPDGYRIEYKIECENRVFDSRAGSGIVEEATFGGERIFIDKDYNNCIVRYWIWTR